MTGAVYAAEELASEDGYFMPQQFQNLSNPEIPPPDHRALEIWTALEGLRDAGTASALHAFVTGVGTGGTNHRRRRGTAPIVSRAWR